MDRVWLPLLSSFVDADTEPEVQAIEVKRKKLLGQAEIPRLVVSMSDHGFYLD